MQQKGQIAIIGQMRMRKALADIAEPLNASLEDQQKKRFANELIRISRGPDAE